MVKWEDDRKKHTTDDMMIDMNPADYYLNVMKEYVIDIVWVSSEIEAINVKLR